ncbi:MAG: SPFH/Band 7/PHB domain protein [Verrucomicrobia bacterium]|nr:SPFH/Band 7/PHB domain protein [Verrucomicrobiota bacterium]MBU6445914.1 SPFH/Band 7/PHB domain protein [Verrucomicrobiota bacterium]MDE3046976.1 SPFH/Band 7/PHB domain protein [Verrucomicrobiota bacterium]
MSATPRPVCTKRRPLCLPLSQKRFLCYPYSLMLILFFSLLIFLSLLYQGLKVVPEQQVWIVQRFGKYTGKLEAGLNWIIPLIDVIANRVSLKEEAIDVPEQTAITQDNVSVVLDGIVYVKVSDPVATTYGVINPINALTQLVQTTMRSEIGKIPLDKTFEERESLNAKIVEAINEAALTWGVRCLRYEIRDIKMPEEIRKAMELQMIAERQKRARILESEGVRQAQINQSEGSAQAQINESKAAQIDRINRAGGEADAIITLSNATAQGIGLIAEALGHTGGERAASLQIAEKYIEAFRQLAKESNTIILPSNLQNPSSMVLEAMTLYDALKKKPAPYPIPVEK